MSDHARRLAKAESALACGWTPGALLAPMRLILVRGGIPTASGRPESKIGDAVLVHEDGEAFEDFRERVLIEARLIGSRVAVITGLPQRGRDEDDSN